jgi:hypothetical protein
VKAMRNPQTASGVFILVSSVICLPISVYGRQVALMFASTPLPDDDAIAIVQAQGSAKILRDASSLAVVPDTRNGAPQLQRTVNLTWKASPSSGVKYNVYRSSTKGDCLKAKLDHCEKINPSPVAGTSYTDSAVQVGQSYFYVVKAVSSGGTESGPSNEAPAVISSPRP